MRSFLAAGLMMLGAAMQFGMGGMWLLIVGSLAMGYRIALAEDDRQGMVFTVTGCCFWTLLHYSMGSNMTRMQVGTEIVTFMCMVIIFWIVRLSNRERFAMFVKSQQREGDSPSELMTRLRQIKSESESVTRESEGWVRLFGVMRDIGEVIRVEEILEVVGATVRQHLKLPTYVLLVAREGVVRVEAQAGFDDGVLKGAEFTLGPENLVNWLFQQRDPLLIDNLAGDARLGAGMLPFRSLVALPMWSQDAPLGVLLALDPDGRTFGREDFARAGILSRQLALGIEKTLLYERVEALSITDGLTHLYTHRYFQERVEGELERARRYGRPLTFLMADLDHFKEYNDAYGHLEGDEVLKMVSRMMEQNFRPPCILARYGGEEFAVLLPGLDRGQGVALAEGFREALSQAVPAGNQGRDPVTISVGVSAFPVDAQTRRDMIARADLALYRAKSDGRNRVRAYDVSLDREVERKSASA